MKILAIDPGPVESAYVVCDPEVREISSAHKLPNQELIELLGTFGGSLADILVGEMVTSYGMTVGQPIFDTIFYLGYFVSTWGAYGMPWYLVSRKELKKIVDAPKVSDSTVRAVMIDWWGPQGTKKEPGVTYGLAKDTWAALALATYYYQERNRLNGLPNFGFNTSIKRKIVCGKADESRLTRDTLKSELEPTWGSSLRDKFARDF